VPIERGWDAARLSRAFEETYRTEYGNTLGDIASTVVSFRTVVEGLREHKQRNLPAPERRSLVDPDVVRPVYFGGWRDTPIFKRSRLQPGMVVEGPAIVEQPDTTTVIEPGMTGRIDAYGNIFVEIS
jgi:N-methylhydantoinase A